MTKKHTLTDEVCREIGDSMIDFPNGFPDSHDHMRAGADWQLEQVMEWLNRNIPHYTDDDGSCSFIASDYLGTCKHINDLKYHLQTAMRPEQEDNS